MKIIEFSVQGSAAMPYEVTFTLDGNKLNAFCTCPAGGNGSACKHRLSIFAGRNTGVVSGNTDQIPNVVMWLRGSEIEKSLAELAAADAEFEQAKQRVSAVKKKLSMSMVRK
jgi:uncharacterized Zn finger protein